MIRNISKRLRSQSPADIRRLASRVGIAALFAVIGLGLVECATFSKEGPSGELTITGISPEYEGKFIRASLYLPPPDPTALFASPKEIGRSIVVGITNGELKLPIYGKKGGYFGNDTINVCLRIEDTEVSLNNTYGNADFDEIFGSVTFNNGAATVKWDNRVKAGFINITNIPSEFVDNTGAIVYIGNPDYDLKVSRSAGSAPPVASGGEGTCIVDFKDGIGTGKFFSSELGKYRDFPPSGSRDTVVQLAVRKDPNNPALSYIFFRFKSAPIQDGKITLNLAQGVRE